MFKRVLLAASVAAVFAAPAFADVTVYGALRTSVEYSKGNGISQVRLVDEKSVLGFKGEDKLDSGLTLIWKSEERLHVGGRVNSPNDWASRDQIIGLKGDFGTFSAGQMVSAYADATYLSPVLDDTWGISDDSNLYNQGINGARNSSLKYVSPSFGGLTIAASAGDARRSSTASTFSYSAVANYSTSLFNAGAAYQRYKDATVVDFSPSPAGGAHSDSYLVGAGVKPVAGLTLSAHWERVKNTFAIGTDARQDDFGLGAEYEIGKWAFRTYYYQLNDIKGSDVSAVSDSGAKHYLLTAKYALSKNTSALAAVNFLKSGSNATIGDTLSLANGATSAAGGKVGAVSLGLRTDF